MQDFFLTQINMTIERLKELRQGVFQTILANQGALQALDQLIKEETETTAKQDGNFSDNPSGDEQRARSC